MIEDSPAKELERLLAKVDILEPLPPEELERLALLSSSMRLEAGQAVAMGEDRETLLLLARGGCGFTSPALLVGSGPHLLHGRGEHRRRSERLRAPTLDGVAPRGSPTVYLARSWVEGLRGARVPHPQGAIKTTCLLGERLAACEGRLSDLIRKEVVARLAGLILSFSEQQGVLMGDSGRMIPTRYTHQQLASMAGSNREAITRALGG